MIKVDKDNSPKAVAFAQVGVEAGNRQRVAKAQVASFARAEVIATAEVDNANFRLTKATESLQNAEIAYFDAVGRSAWNVEDLKKSYNNALAGFRDADRAAEDAAADLQLAKSAYKGILKAAGIDAGEVATAAESAVVEVEKAMDDSSDGDGSPDDSSDGDGSPDDSSSDNSTESDNGGGEILILCPACLGDACAHCQNGFMSPDAFDAAVQKSLADTSGFDTDTLLTPNYVYEDGYQDYIFMKMSEGRITKGGPGSGAQPGHDFNGNQWTGGARSFPRLGIKEGWKQTVSRYQKTADNAKAAAAAHTALAEGHAAVGRSAAAAQEHLSAKALHMTAAGAHEGIASVLTRETGSDGGNRALAAQERAYAGRSNAAAAAA